MTDSEFRLWAAGAVDGWLRMGNRAALDGIECILVPISAVAILGATATNGVVRLMANDGTEKLYESVRVKPSAAELQP